MVSRADSARPASRTGTGILLVAAGVFFMTVNDALIKHLGETYPIVQIVFFRMLFALPLVLGMAVVCAGRRALVTTRPLFHAGRGLLMTVAAFSFYLGLALLPLAEVTAIAFSAPLFVTVLAILFLGERPGSGQWMGVLAGFGGVVLIIRPGTDAFALAAFAPLLTALAYALFMLSARLMTSDERLWTTMTYATLVPLAISAALLPWSWQMPAAAHMPFIVASGLCGGLAIGLITQGFRTAAASSVAPFEYTGMVWAVIFGWLFWNEVPSGWTIVGAGVIAACGVFLAWEHQRASRRRTLPESLPPP